jgi:hypothetical protein
MTDETDPPKRLSLADLIGDQGAALPPGTPASTIADRAALRTGDPMHRAIDWKELIRAAKAECDTEEPRVLRDQSANHMVDTMRGNTRRLNATEEAEKRTVAALEAMREDAQASKADNAKMLWWARAAGIAGIAALILTIAGPIVQAIWARTP